MVFIYRSCRFKHKEEEEETMLAVHRRFGIPNFDTKRKASLQSASVLQRNKSNLSTTTTTPTTTTTTGIISTWVAKNKAFLTRMLQVWSNTSAQPPNRLSYQDASSPQIMRYQSQEISTNRIESPVVVGESMMLQTPTSSSNISPQQQQQMQSSQGLHQGHASSSQNIPNNNPNLHIHHQQIFPPNSQMVQGPMISNVQNGGQMSIGKPGGSILMQGHLPNQNGQQRIFINGPPNESSGPGRPNIQMIPVSVATSQALNQRMQLPFYNQPQYQSIVQQCDHTKPVRHQFMQPNVIVGNQNQPFNGYKQGCPQNVINHAAPTNQILQNSVIMNQPQKAWPHRNQPSSSSQNNIVVSAQIPVNQQSVYERVPPLHQHTSLPTVWAEDLNRKKIKISKSMKKRSFSAIENQHRPMESQPPCPNIDVRQIPNENNRNNLINQYSQQNHTSSSPSFMEDPSGYLAQQTALLNSTISRQTGQCSVIYIDIHWYWWWKQRVNSQSNNVR